MTSQILPGKISVGLYWHPAKEVNAETSEPLNEDWGLLVSFLPANWEDLARQTGALRKLRKHKSPGNLLRTLLLHLGCGHSLRETVVRARRADLADLSDVALLKRLRKSRDGVALFSWTPKIAWIGRGCSLERWG